uniref:Uncharacterized protein n=1 Tax=Arundo donax TaxID=35708 RepID=A0A0A8ZSU7_ARUDO
MKNSSIYHTRSRNNQDYTNILFMWLLSQFTYDPHSQTKQLSHTTSAEVITWCTSMGLEFLQVFL